MHAVIGDEVYPKNVAQPTEACAAANLCALYCLPLVDLLKFTREICVKSDSVNANENPHYDWHYGI